MNNLLILCSLFNVQKTMIFENKETGLFIVQGKIGAADTLNLNGRTYPKHILLKQILVYKNNKVKNNQALGLLDHPDSSTVKLLKVSHNIVDIWWLGNDIVGKIKILGTPHGNILKQLFKLGINVGISSRGIGSVVRLSNHYVVQDDYLIICWDFVSNPSTPGAYMSRINLGKLIIQYDKVNNYIDRILLYLK